MKLISNKICCCFISSRFHEIRCSEVREFQDHAVLLWNSKFQPSEIRGTWN